jgi:hypothetical protein
MSDQERRLAPLRQGLRSQPGVSPGWVRFASALIEIGRPNEVPNLFFEVVDTLLCHRSWGGGV